MPLTKAQVREITKFNYDTNKVARAILICAKSDKELWSHFLGKGALITFRRRFLHNELDESDRKILELVDWAVEECGWPAEVQVN